jgi:hypothetical protein
LRCPFSILYRLLTTNRETLLGQSNLLQHAFTYRMISGEEIVILIIP